MDEKTLQGQEFYILLTWQDTYRSNYFMGHPNLNIDVSRLPDILDNEYYMMALNSHIEFTKTKISFWFENAMRKNYLEWTNSVAPITIEGYYESSMPNDIYSMLVQQLELMNFANDDRFSKETLKFLMNELNMFVDILKD